MGKYPVVLDGLSFPDAWTLAEDLLVGNRSTGALFTTSTGYVGMRGRRREPFGDDGAVLVSGFHETRPYAHPERAYGMPDDYQTIVRATDPFVVALAVDGVAVRPDAGMWTEHRRSLDLRTGCVSTSATWCSPGGTVVAVRSRRLASLEDPSSVWTELEVEPRDASVEVEVVVSMRANTDDRTYPGEPEALRRAWGRPVRPSGQRHDGPTVALAHSTARSAIAVACATEVDAPVEPCAVDVDPDHASRRYLASAAPGRPFTVVQRAAWADGPRERWEEVLAAAVDGVRRSRAAGMDEAIERQRKALDAFWEVARVDLDGDAEMEAAVRFSTFQVLQAAAGNPGRASPAKGLTGQGYQGHHLWDQEVYVGHALSYLAPEATRSLLSFRVATLPQARARARALSHAGAQFPWRTIDGTEASAFFPAGAAQYHVAADIAWAVDHYVACTGDDGFLRGGGLELLVETARFWRSLGRFDDDGRFRIQGVTGPDEYTALVDDNLFTNLMAARNLRSAADRVEAMPGVVAVDDDEVAEWRRASASVVVPYDEDHGIHGQDDRFLCLPDWDLQATPAEELPLQDHHHLLSLYRHQVLKQADLVLALFLLAEEFTDDERRRDFDYYEPRTTHDSSLSAPIHAVVAAGVGRLELAWEYARRSATVDLASLHGTLEDGLHLAAAGGAWLAVACGFGGLTLADGALAFRPALPPGVDRLRFGVRFRDAAVEVEVEGDATTYRLLRGDALTVRHHGEALPLEPGRPVRAPAP